MDTIEYQFGIFGNQNESDSAAALIPVISSFTIKALVVTRNVAGVPIDYVMESFATKGTFPLPVQGFFRIDDDFDIEGSSAEYRKLLRSCGAQLSIVDSLEYREFVVHCPHWRRDVHRSDTLVF
ncbi:hypothetical protein HDU84_006365 [Entophlyctis sp. JEL0112]|nr:hypothetical protein HDU84_006365 [Entophlyctis sp. JEL0112]